MGMRRALAVQGLGDLRLPDPDKDRRCGWADSLRGLSRDGSPAESKVFRSRAKPRHCPTGAVFGGLGNGAAVDQTDNVCASRRNACPLGARHTSGGILPGGGVPE